MGARVRMYAIVSYLTGYLFVFQGQENCSIVGAEWGNLTFPQQESTSAWCVGCSWSNSLAERSGVFSRGLTVDGLEFTVANWRLMVWSFQSQIDD